jgi:hypothetical protein
MIFLDSETVGYHGPIVIIQYAIDDGPIQIHNVWKESPWETMQLIESFMNHSEGLCGFNLAFDHFHFCQMYTTLRLLPDKDKILEDQLEAYAEAEPLGRDGPCLKPAKACDIMLLARQGPYQSTMDRGDIRIRRVPTVLAWQLAQELEHRIPLKDIYFARRKDKYAQKWQIYDIEDDDGAINPDFKDIVLKFAPSSALKALADDALEIEPENLLLFADIELSKNVLPVEVGYAPFAKAIGNKSNWRGSWPDVIRHHITHWSYNRIARQYASDDVKYTRALWHLFGEPAGGDDDSELACMVGAVRWHGYKINIEHVKELKKKAKEAGRKTVNGKAFTIPTAPVQSRYYVTEFMDETSKLILQGSTKRVLLEEISKWKCDCTCDQRRLDLCAEADSIAPLKHDLIAGVPCCERCKSTRIPASRAAEVLKARQGNYEVNLFDKLLQAGRFHASFVVVGTLSSRMAGTDDLNAQGIGHEKRIREAFSLAPDGFILDAGDFDGFEPTLIDAVYQDPKLHEELLSGLKIHGLFGTCVFKDMSYEQILATKGTDDDKYDKSKKAILSLFYGAMAYTLMDRLGVDLETAEAAEQEFYRRYPVVAAKRLEVAKRFQSVSQPAGIGTKVYYHVPDDYIQSPMGFKRYFTLENQICRILFELANKPPEAWLKNEVRVKRRDRDQKASGAVQSALYGCVFALQGNTVRSAINHLIQSFGATITKQLQRQIWDIQPCGIHEFQVLPANIHDEVLCPTKPDKCNTVKNIVEQTIERFRDKVPLIKMDWKCNLKSWADK